MTIVRPQREPRLTPCIHWVKGCRDSMDDRDLVLLYCHENTVKARLRLPMYVPLEQGRAEVMLVSAVDFPGDEMIVSDAVNIFSRRAEEIVQTLLSSFMSQCGVI